MSPIAVEVVLLPPTKIAEKIIAFNKKAAQQGLARGPLGKKDFYPHLSLAMGILERASLAKVKIFLQQIGKEFLPLSLTSSGFAFALKKDGSKSYVLKIRKTKPLQQLHETLMKELKPFLSYRGTTKEVFRKKGETAKRPRYVNWFRRRYCFENFTPHITLRVKELPVKKLKIKFFARSIALCHVGNETTCRKVLFRTRVGA